MRARPDVTDELTFAALALDTTGPNIERDAITAVAAVRLSGGRVLDRLNILVTPTVDVPRQSTGTSVEGGPPARNGKSTSRNEGRNKARTTNAHQPAGRALSELERFAEGCVVVGYGLEAWWPFLSRHGVLGNASACDLAELSTVLLPSARAGTLEGLCRQLGIDDSAVEDMADAAGRVEATRLAFDRLMQLARELDPGVVRAVDRLGRTTGWSLAAVFRSAAASAAERGTPPRVLSVAAPSPKPLRQRDGTARLDVQALEGLIAPGGALASGLPSYRDRPGQRHMLRLVCDAFDLDDQLIVEAGTGTGKTLAYLVPAAAWSLASGRHVVIATNTIALQDQLIGKDVPTVRQLFGNELRACVLKGRANYLCRSRLAALATRDDLAANAVPTVARLLVWSASTRTGDRSELELDGAESAAWRLVSAEGDACTAEHCAHAATGSCWLQRARAEAEAAHLVVVNHALLISDMMVNNRLLPRHDRLVIDEAHHLEEVATTALGFSASRASLRSTLASLERRDERGLLPETAASVARARLLQPTIDWSPMEQGTAELRKQVMRSRRQSDAFFDSLARLLDERGAGTRSELRLTDGIRRGDSWQAVEESWESLAAEVDELRSGLVLLGHALTAAEAHLDGGAGMASDVVANLRDLVRSDNGLRQAISTPSANDVVWLSRRGNQVGVHSVPLHVGEPLSSRLFSDKETLVLTSATLRAGAGFAYIRDRLSLPDAPGEVVASPFDFDASVLVATPSDIPLPGHPDYQDAVDSCVAELATALGGRLMVLYTSYSGLRQTYHCIRGPLGAAGIAVLGQGLDGSRRRLLERFATPERPTVLLGTRSFWEGVDVPGDALRCLVMARLPFDVPTDPVFAARSETFEDPFSEYALPRAVLRFRQGFGRLIRRESDRGVFVLLDSRVLHRGYGRLFLEGLPGGQAWSGPRGTLAAAARQHLDGQSVDPPV
jgi:DNA polymerase-3 subunit epsilon/ATP-dependent DNA helicase DinG